MTLSYFQSYELRRKQFEPGSIWVTKGECVIEELQIVHCDEIPPGVRVRPLGSGTHTNDHTDVTFKILQSSTEGLSDLAEGRYMKWSKEYMKTFYNPLTNE